MANRWGQNPAVRFMLNVVDGCIPSDMSTGNVEDIEEERRLLYVAMTRAKDQLALVVPHRFYVQWRRQAPLRFAHLLHSCEHSRRLRKSCVALCYDGRGDSGLSCCRRPER